MSVIQRGAVLPTQRVISVEEAKEIQSVPEMIMMPHMAEDIAEVIIVSSNTHLFILYIKQGFKCSYIKKFVVDRCSEIIKIM